MQQQQQQRMASSNASSPRTALFFPGQGVQRVGMANDWLAAFPGTARPFLDETDEILRVPLSKIISEGPNSTLTATENSQPAIMATSVMILRILENEFGFKTADRVDVTLGHSLGEFAALVAGGYLRYDDALKMVRTRGEVMAKCSRQACREGGSEYGMVALVCEPDRLENLIEAIHEFLGSASTGSKQDAADEVPPIQQVLIANINSKNQLVLSGSIERINTLLTHLRQFAGHDPRAVRLHSDSPFHSPLMKPAADVMRKILNPKGSGSGGSKEKEKEREKEVVAFPGKMPCISNVTARPFRSKEELKDLLARSCVETVLWWDSIKYLDQEDKVRRWIGIGPGKVGRNLVGKEVGMRGKDTVKGGGVWGISHPRDIDEMLKGLKDTDNARTE
ncbi:malonyl CoA-acyl carrier protein transacylase [Xylona heveae TC161]|uniref:[acyl-carrier-protein] S-malonyltransferase n=1 Tax=Xylona heveae (strain CBS 132557 / TC161) TaxID=1328760 RepID=A0A165J052_XYLHT|nr:malonyl CoA-acyl carrier protein transacylase [Xylona heveae TC161]KZF25608.1 malonyl CoA-acyl carrier protein transacylase [Xylona heveae TC161]